MKQTNDREPKPSPLNPLERTNFFASFFQNYFDRLFIAEEEKLADKTITQFFSEHVALFGSHWEKALKNFMELRENSEYSNFGFDILVALAISRAIYTEITRTYVDDRQTYMDFFHPGKLDQNPVLQPVKTAHSFVISWIEKNFKPNLFQKSVLGIGNFSTEQKRSILAAIEFDSIKNILINW